MYKYLYESVQVLATDRESTIEHIKEKWPSKVASKVTQQDNVLRFDGTVGTFMLTANHHETNTQVLNDIYASSTCSYLLHGFSAVSEAVVCINNKLHNRNINLDADHSQGITIFYFHCLILPASSYTNNFGFTFAITIMRTKKNLCVIFCLHLLLFLPALVVLTGFLNVKKTAVHLQSSTSQSLEDEEKAKPCVTVVQIWCGATEPAWLGRVQRLNRAYAEQHGYNYELLRGEYAEKTHIQKIALLLDRIQHASDTDVFLYMDTDAIVWNRAIALESFDYQRFDMVIPGHYFGFGENGQVVHPKTPSGEPAGVNSGVMIVRGTAWSKRLFELWYSLRFSGFKQDGDQVLLHHLIAKRLIPDFFYHVHFVYAARMNTDDAEVRLGRASKPSAEFIVHLWGGLKAEMDNVLSDIESQRKPRILA